MFTRKYVSVIQSYSTQGVEKQLMTVLNKWYFLFPLFVLFCEIILC